MVVVTVVLPDSYGEDLITAKAKVLNQRPVPASDPPRSVMLVVDPTPSLAKGDFSGAFAAVVRRHSERAKNLRLGEDGRWRWHWRRGCRCAR